MCVGFSGGLGFCIAFGSQKLYFDCLESYLLYFDFPIPSFSHFRIVGVKIPQEHFLVPCSAFSEPCTLLEGLVKGKLLYRRYF